VLAGGVEQFGHGHAADRGFSPDSIIEFPQ
jgi:hypothetical protein